MASPAKSWIDISPESHFSLQNLPYGVFKHETSNHCGVAIGHYVLDLFLLYQAGLLTYDHVGFSASIFGENTLNSFMALPRSNWQRTRARLTNLLILNGDPALFSNDILRSAALIPMAVVQMQMPAEIGDYTDFYSSREHATNVGIMFRGVANSLQPNWLHLPVGYHGRASSVVVSGTDIVRPRGQLQKDKDDPMKGSDYGMR